MPLRVQHDAIQTRGHRALLCGEPIGVVERRRNSDFRRRRVVSNYP
jgi:hypothetical protein